MYYILICVCFLLALPMLEAKPVINQLKPNAQAITTERVACNYMEDWIPAT
jgi:hypothetical protein